MKSVYVCVCVCVCVCVGGVYVYMYVSMWGSVQITFETYGMTYCRDMIKFNLHEHKRNYLNTMLNSYK